MDMNLPVKAGFLRIANQDICNATIPEFQNRKRGIVHFNIWMIDILPNAI